MSTSRVFLALGGDIGHSGATVKNGSGGGAPSRVETSPYVMENALSLDRRIPWLANLGTSGSFGFDIDVGSAKTVRAWFLHNLQILSDIGVVTFDVAGASSYPPVVWSPGGQFVTAIYKDKITRRDFGTADAQQSFRYWRLEIFWTGGLTLRMSLGRWTLGGSSSPLPRSLGEGLQTEQNRLLVANSDGIPTIYRKPGLKGRGKLTAEAVTDAELALFQGIFDGPQTTSMVDVDGNAWEIIITSYSVKSAFVTTPGTGYWDVDMDYEVLP